MTAEMIAGSIALIFMVTYASFGIATQIWRNHQRRSTSGLSLTMIFLSFITFVAWVVYGLLKDPVDVFVVGANSAGAIFTGIILCQFCVYRK